MDIRSNSFRRFNSLLQLCPLTDAIDTDPFILNKYFIKIQHHLNVGPGIFFLNKKIRETILNKKYDIVFVDNKPYLSTKTLHSIKRVLPTAKIVDVLTDDPFGRYSRSWKMLRKTASLYDKFFVQRKVNIEELKGFGAKSIELCFRSYDPAFNRPLILSEEDKGKYSTAIGFVGTYENIRDEYIAYLIKHNIPVSITGDGWTKSKNWSLIKPFYRGPSIYGEEYIKTINGMEIALHFLRHANRDEQDSRTFEIPACGVFMLAEKSDLHLNLFVPDKEAVFFETKEELLQKVKYFMVHTNERESIAKAGLAACKNNNYSHVGRLKEVIKNITGIK